MEEREFVFNGDSACICLEEPFWDCLEDLAAQRTVSLPRLISEIGDQQTDLSSALRVHVLLHYQRLAGFDPIELTANRAPCDVSVIVH
jgi:predicted DNA-binding ribbon-helix-helix protein